MDQLETILRRSPLTQSQRADVWDAYQGAQDADDLATKLQDMSVPKQVKASLWDLKETSVKAAAPAVPEEQFPTPGETATTFAGGAVRALPGMAAGMVEGAVAPVLAVPREVAALVTGGPSPTMQALRESAGHVRAALAPGDAGPGRRVAEAVSAIPGAAPIVKGAEMILTPAYKTATEGVGTVKPAEMKAAAETGGAATAGLVMPEIAKGAGKVSPATVGKVLELTAKHAVAKAVPGGVAGKLISAFILTPEIRAKVGTIVQDSVINAVRRGSEAEAAAAVAKALEKHPEVAEIHAQKVAEAIERSTPGEPAPPMGNTSPGAVAARAAERTARQQAALRGERPDGSKLGEPAPVVSAAPETPPAPEAVAETVQPVPSGPPASRMTAEDLAAFRERMKAPLTPEQSRAAIAARIAADRAKRAATAPEPPSVQVPSAVVEKAVEVLEKRGTLPEKGKSRMPTVYTKPKAVAAEATKFHDDPLVDQGIKESLPGIADALEKGKGTGRGYIETGNHSGDLKPYGATDTGVKAALGLDDMPQSRKVIADAIRRDKGNAIEREVASRLAPQVEEAIDKGYRPAKPIPGQPLTPKEREMHIKQMEAAEAAGLDIWEAFGRPKAGN